MLRDLTAFRLVPIECGKHVEAAANTVIEAAANTVPATWEG
jgi:hypothetical protein